MSTITTRTAKGSELTITELDNNFVALNTDKYQSGASPTFVTATITTVNATTVSATTANLATAILGATRSTSKAVVSTATLTAYSLTAERTYFTGTTGASFAVTFPIASTSNLDGAIYTIMSTVARATTTYISTGATFIGAPAALVANTPYKFQFHLATNQWFIC